MAEKPMSQENELRQIRDLLFGDQKRDLDSRVDGLEKEVVKVETTLSEKIEKSSSGAADDVRSLNEEMMSRLSGIEQSVADSSAASRDNLTAAVGDLTSELKSLGTQLNETNRKLDDERQRREVLANGLRALADAMLAPAE